MWQKKQRRIYFEDGEFAGHFFFQNSTEAHAVFGKSAERAAGAAKLGAFVAVFAGVYFAFGRAGRGLPGFGAFHHQQRCHGLFVGDVDFEFRRFHRRAMRFG